MMKRLIIWLIALCASLSMMSQVAYRQYNKYLDRDEFFDRSRTRIGYAKYDKTWGVPCIMTIAGTL
jgi:hypothetical protein